eukprot:gene9180-11254_t
MTSSSPPTTSQTNSTSSPSYFSELKKGEVAELKVLLTNASNERDPDKIKSVLQRVIYYMTIGVDVSGLFPFIIMLVGITDIVIKKLVYLFICHYSQSNPQLLILVVNTLTNECYDPNPKVRSLAIKNICSLNSSSIIEYSYQNVIKILKFEKIAHVRKTALLGLAKLYKLSPSSINLDEVLPIIYGFILDQDPQVMVNSIITLNEISPKWIATDKVIQHLLQKFKEINEWGQCIIIDTLTRYIPSNQDEMIDILNILDEKFKQSNSALVLGVIKLFLKYTENDSTLYEQVFIRLKEPIITLMENSESNETAFTTLSHIYLLISKNPSLFQKDFKHFYCKYKDPMYIKTLKVKILKEIAYPGNIGEILEELEEYVYEGDMKFAKMSIDAIGYISKTRSHIESILKTFKSFLETEVEDIISYTVIVLKDILRLYPKESNQIIPLVPSDKLMIIEDPLAKESLIWILGEYPNEIEDSPYILENFFQEKFNEQPTSVKIQFLTSTTKIFFQRPGETLDLLKRVIQECSNFNLDSELHDLTLFYYRLLLLDIKKAASIIDSKNIKNITSFVEDEVFEIRDKIFEEFDTLSVLYGKHSSSYLNQEKNSKSLIITKETTNTQQHQDQKNVEEKKENVPQLLIENIDSINLNEPVQQDLFNLEPSPELSPELFQEIWLELKSFDKEIQLKSFPNTTDMENSFLNQGIICLASGSVDDQTKMYFYAQQQQTGNLFLIEIVIDEKSLLMNLSFKSQDTNLLEQKFIPKVYQIFKEFNIF